MNRIKPFAAIVPALALLASCSQETDLVPSLSERNRIIATITDPAATRTCIEGNPEDVNSAIGVSWTKGDQLGVFSSLSDTQTRYYKANDNIEAKEAVFASESGDKTPVYAYYPYTASNEGKSVTELVGEVPEHQIMNGTLQGDWKVGRAAGTGNATNGYTFEFKHLFSLARVSVDAADTDLKDDKIVSVEIKVPGRALCGSFRFNAVNASWSLTGEGVDRLICKWAESPVLSSPVSGYISLIPTIKSGDTLQFTIITDRHTAKLEVTSKVSFEGETLYNFPLTLSNYVGNGLTIEDNPGTTPDPGTLTGTFTCATYNVDGLPSQINKDGPGSSGTTAIGNRINSDNSWDFFGVSEDFEYNSQLVNALKNYNHGTYRGSVGLGTIVSKADTDGLNIFFKKGVTVSDEKFIEFSDSYGDLFHGANTCIRKGFRYYLVTLADGTEIDVYITHMNTFSGKDISESNDYVKAVHSQTRQIVEFIKNNKHKRPIIFMGDTNMRYTRHRIEELLINGVNADSDLEIVDPWVDLAWNNDFSSVGGDRFPQYGGKSLMTSDATGTDSSTDIIISKDDGGLQKGEVVDKVFYINCKNAKTQLKAKSYLRDISFKDANGKALADHYPVVVEFSYTTKK